MVSSLVMTQRMPNDLEYLPSLSLPDAGEIFTAWKARSAAAKARLSHGAELRYGSHPREVMDFYPALNPRGCLVFIHGGYWLGFSKDETCFVAEGFVPQGFSVALFNYPLCPEVKIADIRTSCASALRHLAGKVLSAQERRAVIASGHSAGGHLVAALLADATTAPMLKGVVSLSGVFDVGPLMQTSLNTGLRLDEAQAKALNLIADTPKGPCQLVLAVGELESAEFHRQSTDLATSWRNLSPRLVDVPGTHHFTIVDELAKEGGALNRLAVAMAQS